MTVACQKKIPGIRELGREDMRLVSGGIIIPKKYSEKMYHAVGIFTRFNAFVRDEFRFMGRRISYDMASEMVAMARQVIRAVNEGNHGAGQVGYSEEVFIRAFNRRLYLKYGFTWDGIPGRKY